VLVVVLTVTALTFAPNPVRGQISGIQISSAPVFPASTTVGAQNVPAAFVITNNSLGAPINNQNVTITNIRINASCDSIPAVGSLCPAPEPRPVPSLPILDLEPPGAVSVDPPGPAATGRAGTACAGTVFPVSAPDANGTVTLTPLAPVILGPSAVGGAGAQCIIDFTFDALQRPLDGDVLVNSFVDAATAPDTGQPGQFQTLPNVPGSSQAVIVAAAPPTIVTAASPQNVVEGATFMDTATVTGVPFGPPPTGTVVFRLYRSTGTGFPTCTAGELVSTSAPVTLTGQTPPFVATPPTATATYTPPIQPFANYVFVATYDEADTDVNYTTVTTACGDPAEQVVVTPTLPTIDVQKTADPTTVPEPGGTVTFTVRVVNTGPRDLTLTSLTDDVYGDLATRPGSTCTVAPPGSVPPTPPLLTANGGTYTCTFTGPVTGAPASTHTDVVTATGVDVNGNTATDNDDAVVTIVGVPPVITVIKDATPLTRPEPGGTFTFTVRVRNDSPNETVTITSLTDDIYGDLATRPGSTCGALIGTTLAPGATSAPCTFPGNFFGDVGAAETDVVTVVVTDAEGTSATDSDDATVTITDIPPTIDVVNTATPLTRPAPGGTFTFDVVVTNTGFEPVTITSLTDDVYGNLNGRGTCAVGAALAPNGGTYSCSFPGDFNGVPNAVQTDIVTVVGIDNDGSTATDSDDATVTLVGTPTVLTTQVSAGAVGAEVFDTATLSGGFNPTGTITFQLYGPNNDTCTGSPIFTSVNPVTGATDPRVIVSDRFVLPSPGTYHFVATYSGDANNPPAGPTACLDPAETVAVGRVPINLATQASPTVILGGAISDTATIGGGFNPTGNLTFTVFGPDNTTCAGTPVFTSVTPVNGNGNYISDPFTPTAPGVYRFIAAYSGDANNAPAVTPCDEPLEQVVVTPLPVIEVVKTAIPDSLPVPGGLVGFNVVVTNPSNVALTIRALTDNVYGDVTTLTGSTCNTAIGTVLAPVPGPGNTYTCRFVGDVRGAGGSSHTDVVTVTATYGRGNTVRGSDDATVRITTVPPTIASTVVAMPSSLPEPGGTFTFAFTVTNTGPEPVTVTSLTDNVYGDLNGRGTCAIGVRLAANGGTYPCSFTGSFFGNANATQSNITTTIAFDDHAQTAISQSTATVRIIDVPPSVAVVVTAAPASLPEPGGTFRFTITVTNTSFEPVIVTALVDSVHGDLNGRGTCATGAVVAPNGGTYTCAFDSDFRGRGGDVRASLVTVTAVDDDGTTARGSDDATVRLSPLPRIAVTKTATPATLPEPGGTFTFTATVTNIGPQPVILASLVDDVYGDLAGRGTCSPGVRLAAGGAYTCSFGGSFFGNARASQTDTITATAVDDLGVTGVSRAAATVTITDVAPVIFLAKAAEPASRPAPGGTFRFSVVVVNRSFEPVTVRSLTDNVYGNLNGRGTCAIGAVVAPNGGAYVCAFDGAFTGPAGATETDVVTVTATDDDNSLASASAAATVSITSPPPVPPPTPPAVPTTTTTTAPPPPPPPAPTTTAPLPTLAPAVTVAAAGVLPTAAPVTSPSVPVATTQATATPTSAPPTTVVATTSSTAPPATTTTRLAPTVPPPPATLQPAGAFRLSTPSSPPGGRVVATGSGCAPGEAVVVDAEGTSVGFATAGATGEFEVPIDLPALGLGTAAVVARCGANVLTTTIEVALSTNIEPSASSLAVILFLMLSAVGLTRRRVA
jgi:uncharacterized repeat protein (TIGR01451 family)